MRMQTQSSACGYGHVGYLFERQRAAMRQNSFARARGDIVAAKRKSRDDDSDEDEQHLSQRLPGKERMLEGLKRMRVSSPPRDEDAGATSSSASAMTDVAMNDVEANAQALVAVSKPRRLHPRGFSTTWNASMYSGSSSDDMAEFPTDPSCTAIVLFDPTSSIPRGPRPRVELVESDDEEQQAADAARRARAFGSDGEEEDEEPFVRFEEIHDEDEPMEID